MKKYPDGYFDLAIVDPPFGIGQNWRKDKLAKFYSHQNTFNNQIPGRNYFKELFRVSRHQIIWGCNYYWNFLPPSNKLIFWDKCKDARTQHGSAGELAWTSIKKYPLIKVTLIWNGALKCETTEHIHPHQKPIKLYEWLYHHFAEPGWKILDTHLGSGSNRIAADKMGFDFTGFEKDKKYFLDQQERYSRFLAAGRQHQIDLTH